MGSGFCGRSSQPGRRSERSSSGSDARRSLVLAAPIALREPVNLSGLSPSEQWIAFGLQIRNDGERTVTDLRAIALLGSERVAERGGPVAGRTALGPATFPPNQGVAWEIALPRPELVDLRPDGTVDFYGKKLAVRITHRQRRRPVILAFGELREFR